MRASLVAAAFAGLLACSEPSIAVQFDVPAPYRPLVVDVSLEVIVPSVLEPFTCEAIAYGEIDEEVIAAGRILDHRVGRGVSVPLAGIPRLGPKLFYARGYDEAGVPMVAACADVGDIDGDVQVALVGEPVSQVALPPLGLGEPLPDRLVATVTDGRGQTLGGAPLRWQVTGPGLDNLIEGPPGLVTDDRGRVEILPTAPDRPGPNALDVQVRWASPPPPSLFGYVDAAIATTGSLPGSGRMEGVATDTLFTVGRVGPAGQPGFVALGPTMDVAAGRQALVVYRTASGYQTAVTPNLPGVWTVGRLRGPTRDRVVTLANSQWIEIHPDGSLSVAATASEPRPARRIASIGSCEGAPAGDRLLVWHDSGLVAYDDSLAPTASPFVDLAPAASRLLGAGCVAAPTDPVRAAVYAEGSLKQTIVTDLDGGRAGPWIALPSGVGFLPRIATEGPYLLGSMIAIDGSAVMRVRLAPVGGGGLIPEIVTDDDSASIASSTAGGDIDGDGRADVVAVLPFGEAELGGVNLRLLVALGVPHRGGRLVGVSGPLVARAPAVFVLDFDRDGIDDVLLAAQDSYAITELGP